MTLPLYRKYFIKDVVDIIHSSPLYPLNNIHCSFSCKDPMNSLKINITLLGSLIQDS